jgi:hypothetical protein
VFLVNPPLIALMLALLPQLPAGRRDATEPGHPDAEASRIDVPGALLVTTAIAALIYGLSNGQQHGFGAPASLTALIAAVLLMIAFIFIERNSRAPMLPLAIFSAPARRAAVVAMLMMGAILAGYVYFISLYLQKVQGFSPVETGLALVPSTLTVVVTSTFGTRRLLARLDLKWVLLAGLTCMAAGQLWLAQISAGALFTTTPADRGRRRPGHPGHGGRVRGHPAPQPSASGEVVALVEVGEKPGVGRLPAQELPGFRIGHRDAEGDERERLEVVRDLVGRNALGRDAEVAGDDLGDLPYRDALFGRGEQL